ncbi:hypothetical protein L228DRAFT_259927 [Xylona heveae TC161]|uniref:Uncharacterized protein n=1 Tax=Xylona heveae (strain CBS 132557 / TC161) TaxID=1328760 RepID=A0A165IE03_XYLHT|nr:hypothetical protein L228DRAFT_259927 [Xylona heveae TC161]KZF24760.1 hypothetical protein L228DRAFT_259927 [Xylona heveae TC161]
MKIGPPYPFKGDQSPQRPSRSTQSVDEEPPPYTEWEPFVRDLSRIASSGAQAFPCEQDTSSSTEESDSFQISSAQGDCTPYKEETNPFGQIDGKVHQFILPIREKPQNCFAGSYASLPVLLENPLNENELSNFSHQCADQKEVERMASIVMGQPVIVNMSHVDPLAAEFTAQELGEMSEKPENSSMQRSESFAPGDDKAFSSTPINEKTISGSEEEGRGQHSETDNNPELETDVIPEEESGHESEEDHLSPEEKLRKTLKQETMSTRSLPPHGDRTEIAEPLPMLREIPLGSIPISAAQSADDSLMQTESTSGDSVKIDSVQPLSSSSGVTSQLAGVLNNDVFGPAAPVSLHAPQNPDSSHSDHNIHQPGLMASMPQSGHINVSASKTNKYLLDHFTDTHVSLTSSENPNSPIPSITDSCIGSGSIVVAVDCRRLKFATEDRQDDEFYTRFGGIYMVLQMFNDQWAFCSKLRMTTALCQYCYDREQENKKFSRAGLKRLFRRGSTKEVKKPDYRIQPEVDPRMGPLLGFLPLSAVTLLPNMEDYCAREKVLTGSHEVDIDVPMRTLSLQGASRYYDSDGVLVSEEIYQKCFENCGGRCFHPLTAKKILKQLYNESIRESSRERAEESAPKLSTKRSIKNFFTGTFSRRGNGHKRTPLPK